MDQAKAEQIVNELQFITRVIFSGEVSEFKPSATLLEKSIKPSERPFIKKDASGHALYFIVQGKAGVYIGQPERIIVPEKRTVGEMSMISTVINAFGNRATLESRTADVYAEEPMQVIVFNYSPLVEILKEPDPAFRKFRHQILINLNRIMFRKLMEVNSNYINMLLNYGLTQEASLTKYPSQIVEDINRFLKKMRTIPNISVSPHDMRGILIREGEPNPALVFLHEGKVKISKLIKDEETEQEERFELDITEAPMIIGESSILNVGAISTAQVETVDKVIGYRIGVQILLRHLQRYPDMFEDFFKLLLELNYFRTVNMMQKTTNL